MNKLFLILIMLMMWGCEDGIYDSNDSNTEEVYSCDDGSNCIPGGDPCVDGSECTSDSGEGVDISPLCQFYYDSNGDLIDCSEDCIFISGLFSTPTCFYQSDVDVLYDIIDLNESLVNTGNIADDIAQFGSGWWVGRLYVLMMPNKELTYLPESIENLPLLYLWLDNNELTSLPESFCNLSVDWGGYNGNLSFDQRKPGKVSYFATDKRELFGVSLGKDTLNVSQYTTKDIPEIVKKLGKENLGKTQRYNRSIPKKGVKITAEADEIQKINMRGSVSRADREILDEAAETYTKALKEDIPLADKAEFYATRAASLVSGGAVVYALGDE